MSEIVVQDETLTKQQFLDDVVSGLQNADKSIPCKYLYDERGSQLFEQICELDEYYLTRTELGIMRSHAAEMAARLGAECVLVEYGSGSSLKTKLLLERLESPAAYVPVDISRTHLEQTAQRIARRYPQLVVRPVCADFTKPFTLPKIESSARRTAVYFPGSTIGNFGPRDATALLKAIAKLAGEGGGLLIGVDLHKRREILEQAYDDDQGVTEEFNLNILAHINRELDADFQLDQFRHRARFNEEESRMEMHLVSTTEQTVRVDGEEIELAANEAIHTENSYKYTLERFEQLARSAGFSVEKVWCDDDRLFSVQYLCVD